MPAKYDGFEGLPPKAADAATDAGRRPGRLRVARRRHLDPHAARAARRLPADRVHARMLRRRKADWERGDFDAAGEQLALQQRLVRVARLRRDQLHVAGLPTSARRLHGRDPARLAPLRDQRLPVPRGIGRGRSLLQRQPAEGGPHRRLLRRRLLVAGAHRPEVDRAPAARR